MTAIAFLLDTVVAIPAAIAGACLITALARCVATALGLDWPTTDRTKEGS